MQEPFVIGGETIPRGATRRVEIDLPSFYGTPTSIFAYVLRGRAPGPTVFVSAAIHGDELNGVEIIRRLRQYKGLKRLHGTLILVPFVNIYGVMNQSRYLPDRRDLNRSFPGSEKGSLASRLAHTFFKEIVEKADLGIDLHTGSIHKSNLPQIRTDIDDPHTLTLAKVFDAPVILNSELRDGSLRGFAQEAGIPVLLYEAGEALRFDEKSIKIGVRGILNVLRSMEMLPIGALKARRKPIITQKSSWVRAPQSGFIHSRKLLGDTVKAGDVIGHIYDAFDETNEPITASLDGVIIGKSQIPLAHEGDAIFHIAHFSDLKIAEERIERYDELIEDAVTH